MSLLVLVHAETEGPGVLGRVLQDHGHKLRFINLYQNLPLPPDLDNVDGLVIMGGPMNVDETAQHPWLVEEMACIKSAHQAGLPIVGICLGAQLIAAALGGEVKAMPQAEIGWHALKLAFPGTTDPLFAGTPGIRSSFICMDRK
ncbi:MAG: type 1 glutamine amidotransferase [Phycisphaerales bacterium]|nr:type 1 glutamine amidotransferase [Phycisphaerales bacterium]